MASSSKHTAEQWAGAGAISFFGVLIGALIPWYSVVTAYSSKSLNGFDEPFLGTWAVVLGGVGLLAAGLFALSLVKGDAAKAVLSVGTLVFVVAWVLTLVDTFRDVPTFYYAGVSGARMFGVYSASACALMGAAFTGQALAMQMKRDQAAEPAAQASA